MRILQVIPSVDLSNGGPSVVVSELNRAFRKLGHDARILTIGSRESGRELPPGVRVIYCRLRGPAALELSPGLFATVLRFARSADVIAMDSFYNAHALPCYLAARIFGTPIVIQPHGVFDPEQRKSSTTQKQVFDRAIGNRLLRRADGLHFSSTSERSAFDRSTARAELAVVPHGAQLPAAEPVHAIAEWLAAGGYTKVFSSVGRLAAKKQPDLLIKAWSRISTTGDSCLVVAGGDDDWTVEQLRALVTATGATNVYLAGQLRRSEVAWLLQQSSVFVLPSWEENFGLTILEALSAGCYVLTTRAVSASTYIDEGRSGWVLDEVTIESVAAGILRVLDDWTVTTDVSAHSSTMAPAVSWEDSALSLLALYERAAAHRREVSHQAGHDRSLRATSHRR